jgi:type IV pilus assembly protein PilQ
MKRLAWRLGVGLVSVGLMEGTAAQTLLDQDVPWPKTVVTERALIHDVSLKREPDGSAELVLGFNRRVPLEVVQHGNTLTAEMAGAAISEGLSRTWTLTHQGHTLVNATLTSLGDKVRLVAESSLAVHSFHQSGLQWLVSFKPQPTHRSAPPEGMNTAGFEGAKMSLNFQNIEVRALLQVMADFTKLNVVASDSVTGQVTLRLNDVPWDQALDIILQAKGLGMRRSGNVMWIAPRDEILAREKLERESALALDAIEPLRTQTFVLNYAKAQDVARQLLGVAALGSAALPVNASARLLSARGSAIGEVRTNQLFVTDTIQRLQQVAGLVRQIDIPVRQVLIEARIVEASDTFSKALGARLGGGSGAPDASSSGGVQVGGSYSATAAGVAGGNLVNLPVSGAAGVFAVSIFGEGAARFLNLELSALEADGKGKIVSSPRVVTADKVKAVIEQGTELPYQVASASGATAIAFRKANLVLEVTPQITTEGGLILELDINKDSVGQLTTAGYAIDTKHIRTQVLVDNGGTVVIGGIFTMNEITTENKVPFFGDLPGLGRLFKSQVRASEKKEMLVFITPKMVAR